MAVLTVSCEDHRSIITSCPRPPNISKGTGWPYLIVACACGWELKRLVVDEGTAGRSHRIHVLGKHTGIIYELVVRHVVLVD